MEAAVVKGLGDRDSEVGRTGGEREAAKEFQGGTVVEDGGQRDGEEHYKLRSSAHFRYFGMAKSFG